MPDTDDSFWYDTEETEYDSTVTEYELTAAPNDFNTKTLFDFIESGSVKIPGFQRHYVWDLKRASKLIESIIMGIPIPQVFLYEEGRNRFLVIDGQQRLMTIYYFFHQRFPRLEKRADLRRLFDERGHIPPEVLADNKFFVDFNLALDTKPPVKPNKLHGLNYNTLGDYKTQFDLRTIRNVIIKQTVPANDDSSIYEIFNRLNSGGVNLTPQEIRMSLYHSSFYDMLYRINADVGWRKLLAQNDPDIRMKDIEILLRGFAMLMEGGDYKPSMLTFLNSFSRKARSFDAETVAFMEALFKAFVLAVDQLNSASFFGLAGRKFNISMFEAIFTAACRDALEKKNLALVHHIDPEQVELLKSDTEFINATQSRTADARIVDMRLAKAKQFLI